MRKTEGSLHLQADLWLWESVLTKNDYIYPYFSQSFEENLPTLIIRTPHRSALDTAVMVARNHSQ